ncbi:MAG: hypothetical protein U0903_22465 [Planctomycetales bacterium]
MFWIVWSARLSFALYSVGQGLRWRTPESRIARLTWTAGCALLAVHILLAFGLAHGWSHVAAYDATARRTFEYTGWNSGMGLYFNEITLALWGVDVLWSWSVFKRPRWWTVLVEVVLAFMFFNAVCVFAPFESRVIGGVIFAGLTGVGVFALLKRNSLRK